MAKSKTPAKRARKAEENRIKNKAFRSTIKTTIKKFDASVSDNNLESARENLIGAISLIDKSINKGIMHKNTAARKKSALARKLNQLVTAE